MCPERSWNLEPTSEAPRRARQWVNEALQLWDLEDLDAIADVLTSELVTNAVRHARTELVLRVIWEIGRLRVEVEDRSAKEPVLRSRRRDELGDGGYGLVIVERLADTWGWEPTQVGKRVWCEIRADGAAVS